MRWMTGCLPTNWLPRNTVANSQLSTVGFHLMNVGSRRNQVAPPKTTIKTSEIRCMVSTFRVLNHVKPTCSTAPTMAARVAI